MADVANALSVYFRKRAVAVDEIGTRVGRWRSVLEKSASSALACWEFTVDDALGKFEAGWEQVAEDFGREKQKEMLNLARSRASI